MLLLSYPGRGLGHLGVHLVAGLFQVPPDVVASHIPMAAPIPESMAEVAHRKAIDKLMCEESEPWISSCGYPVFDDDDGDVVNEKMAVSIEPGHHKPGTYGEVTTIGARQLFYHMGLSGTKEEVPEDEEGLVFMDLGSGVGKLVVQAFMELPRISQAIGIELAPVRHQHALAAWKELEAAASEVRKSREPVRDATLELLEADIFDADLSKATHLYISSLCFSDAMMHRLAAKLEQEAPRLQCVATLRAFPMSFRRKGILDRVSYEVVMKTLGMIERTEYVEMSWTKHTGRGCQVVIYTKP